MNRHYKLEFYKNDNELIDISKYVFEISHFTDVGTGEGASAKIGIDTRFGDFLNHTFNDDLPLINADYPKFRLTITDDDGRIFRRNLILDDYLPQIVQTGVNTFLELYGEELWLQKMYVPGHFYFQGYREMLRYLIRFYNDQRGAKQPLLQTTAFTIKDIPPYTYGTFDFGQDTTVYEALMEIVRRLNLPVSAGGAGQFYDLRFDYQDETSFTAAIFRVGQYPQTIFVPDTPTTIQDKDWNRVVETRKQITQNLVLARGQTDTGTFPNVLTRYASRLEEFNEIRDFQRGYAYMKDAYARYAGKLYQARRSITENATTPTNYAPPNEDADWEHIVPGIYIKGSNPTILEYSPWTHAKEKSFRASAGNPQATESQMGTYDGVMFHDGNILIKDGLDDRIWAIARAKALTDSNLTPYKKPYNSSTAELPPETILLIDASLGSIGAPWIGNDRFGKPYQNSVVKLTESGDWVVIKEAIKNVQCAVISEGKIYEYGHLVPDVPQANVRQRRTSNFGPIAWRDISKTPFGNDCFHPPDIIENTTGLLNEKTKDDVEYITIPGSFPQPTFTTSSALRIVYKHVLSPATLGAAQKLVKVFYDGLSWGLTNAANFLGADLTASELQETYRPDAYKRGWWVSGSFPFPRAKFDSSTPEVGSLAGGDKGVVDFYNLNETPQGKMGWNSEDADELGSLTGIGFALNLDILFDTLRYPKGDIPMRITIGDSEGNTWSSDFNYRLLGQTEFYSIPFSSFSIYRARTQIGFSLVNAIHRIIQPERKILEIFETRKVAWWSIQCMLEYDIEGRYEAWNWLQEAVSPFVGNLPVTYDGKIDLLHFIKTPIAIAKDSDTSERFVHVEPRNFPNISNYEQLQKTATAQLDLDKFRPDLYSVNTNGICDLRAGYSVFLKSPHILSSSDNDTENNKKLTVRKVIYSINSAERGAGFLREIQLYKLIND
ncbi:MAG: hypothetical protein K8823_1521 [Cenarchaeum symbiont of Oopsacas minuta]|nr:hypothetical protein [Cenarchaeum symbiont of Oopsacas minuta]